MGLVYGLYGLYTELPLPEVKLSPQIILSIFVRLLIFSATHKICFFHFRKVVPAAALLGSVGIIISMVVTGAVLHFGVSIAWLPALLFGVIVSATDPLAVGALLQGNQPLSEEAKLLIEGDPFLMMVL